MTPNNHLTSASNAALPQRLTQRHGGNGTQAIRGNISFSFSPSLNLRVYHLRKWPITIRGAVVGSASTLGYRFIDGLSVWRFGYKFHKVQAEKSSHRWPWEGNITLTCPFCLTAFLMIENPPCSLNKHTGTAPVHARKGWFYEFDSFYFSHLN